MFSILSIRIILSILCLAGRTAGIRPGPGAQPEAARPLERRLRSISEISSCFVGPRPWHIEIRHCVRKTSTINLFGFETLKLKIQIMETDRGRLTSIVWCDYVCQFSNQVIIVWYAFIRIQSPDEKHDWQQSHHMIDSVFRQMSRTAQWVTNRWPDTKAVVLFLNMASTNARILCGARFRCYWQHLTLVQQIKTYLRTKRRSFWRVLCIRYCTITCYYPMSGVRVSSRKTDVVLASASSCMSSRAQMSRTVRPISILRFWISEDLTQA